MAWCWRATNCCGSLCYRGAGGRKMQRLTKRPRWPVQTAFGEGRSGRLVCGGLCWGGSCQINAFCKKRECLHQTSRPCLRERTAFAETLRRPWKIVLLRNPWLVAFVVKVQATGAARRPRSRSHCWKVISANFCYCRWMSPNKNSDANGLTWNFCPESEGPDLKSMTCRLSRMAPQL